MVIIGNKYLRITRTINYKIQKSKVYSAPDYACALDLK